LIACRGGCGPSGLALFWEQPDGDFSSGYLWLTPSGRNEVQETLDQRPTEAGEEKEARKDEG
jgi:hypothetical protein